MLTSTYKSGQKFMIMDNEHKHEWKAEQHFKELEGNTHIGYVTYKCECGAEATDKELGMV